MDRNPSAQQRSGLLGSKIIGNPGDVGSGCFDKFGISTVHRHPGNLLLSAEVLVAFAAKLTVSTRPMDPGHADAVTDIYTPHGRASLNNGTDHFVPEDERPFDDPSQLRPVAIRHVQIGVAHAANLDLDKNFAPGGFGNRDILNRKGGLEVAEHGSFHVLPLGTTMSARTKNRLDHSKNSGLEPSQEKLYCTEYSICELVRSG